MNTCTYVHIDVDTYIDVYIYIHAYLPTCMHISKHSQIEEHFQLSRMQTTQPKVGKHTTETKMFGIVIDLPFK